MALGAQAGHVVTYRGSPEEFIVHTVFTKKCQKWNKKGVPPVFNWKIEVSFRAPRALEGRFAAPFGPSNGQQNQLLGVYSRVDRWCKLKGRDFGCNRFDNRESPPQLCEPTPYSYSPTHNRLRAPKIGRGGGAEGDYGSERPIMGWASTILWASPIYRTDLLLTD